MGQHYVYLYTIYIYIHTPKHIFCPSPLPTRSTHAYEYRHLRTYNTYVLYIMCKWVHTLHRCKALVWARTSSYVGQ